MKKSKRSFPRSEAEAWERKRAVEAALRGGLCVDEIDWRPPPSPGAGSSRWEHLPLAHRQRLLELLSHLLERQLPPPRERGEEDGHDAARVHR